MENTLAQKPFIVKHLYGYLWLLQPQIGRFAASDLIPRSIQHAFAVQSGNVNGNVKPLPANPAVSPYRAVVIAVGRDFPFMFGKRSRIAIFDQRTVRRVPVLSHLANSFTSHGRVSSSLIHARFGRVSRRYFVTVTCAVAGVPSRNASLIDRARRI